MKSLFNKFIFISLLLPAANVLPVYSATAADTLYIGSLPTFESYAYPGSTITTVTGIRGKGITGNYQFTSGTGGLLYQDVLRNPQPFPIATANGSNYPGATTSTPYGPTVGSPGGILRVTGSYNYNNSGYRDIGYLYDGAPSAGRSNYTSIIGSDGIHSTIFTIGHSNFGNLLVGNFDTQLNEGQAFLHNISNPNISPYVINTFTGATPATGTSALSSTAYGVYGNMIAGGATFANPSDGNNAYIARLKLDANGNPVTTTPGFQGTPERAYTFLTAPALIGNGIITHFEGITSGGRANTYNLIADSVGANGSLVAAWAVRYNAATGDAYWLKYDAGKSLTSSHLTSANSIYQNRVIGVYVDNAVVTAYSADISNSDFSTNAIHTTGSGPTSSLLYDPVLISSALNVSGQNSIGNSTQGDDVINNSTVAISGTNSIGLYSSNYNYSAYGGGVDANFGTITNNGIITAKGTGSTGVISTGLFGTILNYGTIQSSTNAYAIQNIYNGQYSTGLIVVNNGSIDGVVNITNDSQARFENSGWMGTTSSGSGVTHNVSGVFSQTSNGTLGIRTSFIDSDKLLVNGIAYLKGGLSVISPTQGASLVARKSFNILTATGGITGGFSSATTNLSFLTPTLSYNGGNVYMSYSQTPFSAVATNINQRNVGNALTVASFGPITPGGQALLDTLFTSSTTNAPQILATVSGAGLAGVQTTSIEVGQMVSSTISDQIAFWRSGETNDVQGITLTDRNDQNQARGFMSYAPTDKGITTNGPIKVKGPVASLATIVPPPRTYRAWGSMFGGGANFLTDPGRGAPAAVVGYYGGIVGVDYQLMPNLLIGAAFGGSNSNFSAGSLSTSGNLTGFHAGLYGAYNMGASYLALNETFSAYSNQTNRSAGGYVYLPSEQLSANFSSTEFRTRLEGGHSLLMGGLKATPFIAAEVAAYNSGAFSEHSSIFYLSSFALKNNGQAINSLPTFIGLRLSNGYDLQNGMRIAPIGSVAYVHEFFPQRQFTNILMSLPDQDFNVAGPRSTYNLVQTKMGVQLNLNQKLAMFTDFQGEFSPVSQSYAGKIGVKYVW